MAKIFEPIAGAVGSTIFALGPSGAAFSAMVANATAGGTMLSDALGKGPSPSTIIAKRTSAVILLWGLVVTLTFTKSPVQLIIFTQALTVLITPLLGFLLFVMSNNHQLMEELRNTWWKNVIAGIRIPVDSVAVRVAHLRIDQPLELSAASPRSSDHRPLTYYAVQPIPTHATFDAAPEYQRRSDAAMSPQT